MKIAVIDDYQNAFKKVKAYPKLKQHEVVVYNDTEKNPEKLAARLADADAVVLTQQRSPLPRAVIEKLPKLKLISQTGKNAYHIGLAACTEKRIVVSLGVAAARIRRLSSRGRSFSRICDTSPKKCST